MSIFLHKIIKSDYLIECLFGSFIQLTTDFGYAIFSRRGAECRRDFCYFFALLCAFARDFLINAHNFISYHFIEIFPDEHHREAARHISFFIIHYEGFSDIR